jgi:putative two-component system response regulator
MLETCQDNDLLTRQPVATAERNRLPIVTLVDDEPYALDVMVRAARAWRFECQAAASAEQAVELLEKNPTPIVVTDLRMPGRGGVWLVREIQKRWPEVSIIVLTAGHDTDAVAQSLDAGAHHYFLKPIKLDEFRHALEANLRTYRRQREHEHYRRKLEKLLARQSRRLRQTFLSAIDSLVRTLEARDPYTSGHSLRVRDYVLRLADVIGLERRLRRQLGLAAKLHDIGKVGMPEAILNKRGPLTADEMDIVKKHPVIGERILTPILRSQNVLSAIRNHHERYDGQGYPDRLKGEGIPLLARLLTVADCFDAMTSSRAYRKAMSREEAVAVLRAGAGTQFDPAFVPPFLKAIESE